MTLRLVAACVTALIVAAGATAEAQGATTQPSATWGIMAGGEVPTGAYNPGLTPGVAIGALAEFPLSPRRISIRADVMLHVDDFNGVCETTGCASPGINLAPLVSGSLSIVARLNDAATRWSPYLVAGGAAYAISDELGSFRPNHLGVQGGVGFEFRPERRTYFVEVRYMGIPPGGVLPVVVGMRF